MRNYIPKSVKTQSMGPLAHPSTDQCEIWHIRADLYETFLYTKHQKVFFYFSGWYRYLNLGGLKS